jgi:DNA polymerase
LPYFHCLFAYCLMPMPLDSRQELRQLLVSLQAWLAFQGRLGWEGIPLPPKPPPPSRPAVSTPGTLAQIRQEMGDCQRCPLGRTRKHLVFGEGSSTPRWMFVGEGPGEEEDLQGRPFVGSAGQLLNNLLSKLGLSREEVYIANVVKCRPPGNRDPEANEIARCLPFLAQQIQCLRPKVIITLGKVASQALLATQTPITRLRGSWQRYQRIPVMPTFHPSYLLRNPRERFKTWEDMKQVMEYLARHEQD